jgi:protein-disulfide isomerase
LVYRDYPLPNHPRAQPAAEAAQCAHAQGKFWEYHDAIFANQRTLETENLKRFAADLGLAVDEFNRCFDSGSTRQAVEEDYQEGQRMGVNATPVFFINGRFLSGAQPLDVFKAIIDEELKE